MSNDGNVNPMVPGKKVVAIFGFCDIHHFNIVNEVLQENILEFVNDIANVVHGTID